MNSLSDGTLLVCVLLEQGGIELRVTLDEMMALKLRPATNAQMI